MEKKAYPLGNKGMLRDTSISKRDHEHAYENFNIRITANDKETLLSVTNERGHVISSHIAITNGYYLGHCVIENYVVLFVTDDKGEDRIIRCEFNSDGTFKHRDVLFSGTLNFDKDHPIETLGQVETNQVKKVYWVDGKNLTRVIDIMKINQGPQSERDPEYGKLYSGFDFMPSFQIGNLEVDTKKSYDGSGYMKPGTIQYFLTLYHKMGTETGVVWASPLCYSSFEDRGASPEETTPTKFTFTVEHIDESFEYARLYAYGKSSENTSAFAYIVDDVLITNGIGGGTAIFIDNGANNTDIDPNQILFLGGQEFIASTLIDKNGKLFLGNLKYQEADDAGIIDNIIKKNCFEFVDGETEFTEGVTYKSKVIQWVESSSHHPNSNNTAYPYTIDLRGGNIKGFKRGNKYRFGVQFIKSNGALSRTYWIGDSIAEVNKVTNSGVLDAYALAGCDEMLKQIMDLGYTQYRLMYVKPSATDRLVLSQGVINPTVFNINERYYDRVYAQTSWITRPFNSSIANNHLEVIGSANTKYGEIQNLEYAEDDKPTVKPDLSKIKLRKFAYRFVSSFQRNFWSSNTMWCKLEIGYVENDITFKPENEFLFGPVIDNVYTKNDINLLVLAGELIAPQLGGLIAGSTVEKYCAAEIYRDKIKTKLSEVFSVYPKLKGHIDIDLFLKQLIVTDKYWMNTFNWETINIVYYYTPDDGDLSGKKNKEDFHPLYEKHHKVLTASIYDLYSEYVENIKNAYFVDNSIVTFDSPDTRNLQFSSKSNKVRIIGISRAKTNTFSFDINIKTPAFSKYASKALFENTWNYSSYNCAIVNAPLWYGATHTNIKDYDIQGIADADGKTPYYIYMWQTNTSIENYSRKQNSSDGSQDVDSINYSEIDTKIFANRYYGDNTTYLSKYYDCSIADIKNTFGNKAINVNHNGKTILFANSIDTVLPLIIKEKEIINKNDKKEVIRTGEYNVYTGQLDIDWKYNATAGRSVMTSLMKYVGSDSVVISMDNTLPAINTNLLQTSSTIFSEDNNLIYLLHSTNKLEETDEDASIYPIDTNEGIEITKNVYLFLKNDINIDIAIPYRLTKNNIYDCYAYIQKASSKGLIKYWSINVLNEGTSGEKYELHIDSSRISAEEVNNGQRFYSLVDSNIYVYNNSIGKDFCGNLINESVVSGNVIIENINNDNNPYLYIAEIYRNENVKSDFGGISQSALNNNIYYPCSNYTKIDKNILISNDGDTYHQRYDCLRIKPYSDSDVNQVVDICSVMLDTYTNLDGRYDTKRYTSDLLTIDWKNFAPINPAYNSDNNVITGSVLDDRYNSGDYSSSIVHSLVKEPNSLVDTWSNITMAGVVGLDSDKGPVNKLTKYANNIYAFQDKAIEQILYDERTQITPSIGVPVEIANSATVSHHMITDMYGSKHKRSIVTAKSGLYFYDYNNGVICSFGEGVQPISTTKGFDTWVREHSDFEGFYDKRHGDIYFLTTSAGSTDYDTLCYNEYLGEFTSFYQYNKPNFMFNLYDHWMSYKDRKYWINNEGEYGNIYDNQQDSLIEYKITPDPYGDKLFTNINYRTDFFDGDTYQEKKTFSHIRAYNEYQDTGDIEIVPVLGASYMPYKKGEVKSFKKFRIWNMDIPRVESSKMDRIRNPWVQIVLQTDYTPLRYEFHNANVIYYE